MLELENVKELGRVCLAWIKREGPFTELMLAWLEVVSGNVLVDDKSANRATG